MMVGGSEESWQRLRPILELIAARYKGDPCVARVGPDGAGHFVKMVHNGIEYADMQMIAEIYGLLRFGAAWTPEAIGRLFAGWNRGALRSYLLEITADILQCFDPETGHPMVDVIRDSAGQKGTGRWTVIEAVRLGQSASMIEAALGARAWSAEKDTRMAIEGALGGARGALDPDPERLAQAMWTARLLAHAQGFRVMAAASPEFGWSLDLARIAEIWRAGCIIRSAMLDDIAEAFRGAPPRGELILSPLLAERLEGGLAALREEVASAVPAGHAVPVLSAGLQWIDTMRQGFGTAGIIQAQRDYFGRHGFERFDREGLFHGPWWRG